MLTFNYTIKFEKFENSTHIKKHCIIPILCTIAFIFSGTIQKNLFLPANNCGLFEHINIWIFLSTNIACPLLLYKLFSNLKKDLDEKTYSKLKKNFEKIEKYTLTQILKQFSRVIGFVFFVVNSLQNAKLINQLPFDYWDSSNYPLSYILSRIYKLYLFVYFIPYFLMFV